MPRRTLIAFLSAAGLAGSASAFHVSAPALRPAVGGTSTALRSKNVRHSPLEDSPWETDPSYYDRLREAAKDPATFEAFVMSAKPGRHPEEGAAAARARAARDEIQGEASPKAKKKGGYQRIEEWDEEQRSKQDGSGMTWEEKVQFDGLRQGNQVRQNDILMHHLHSF